ncbi:MAG: hypothetical protein HEQ33_13865 [Dolichospermum sp. WA123]|nr:hypothetical protein [Dolichospermum sp. WA123]
MGKSDKHQSIWLILCQKWYWLIFFIPILIVVIYSAQQLNNHNYWDGAAGNLLATLLGIITGVPIALEIERDKIKREEQERINESKDRAKQVSFLLKEELLHNLSRLKNRQDDKTSLPLQPLKITTWHALCDSAEIKWINNPILLSSIASAYHYISIVSEIESRCYQALRGINVKYDDGVFASQRLLEDARIFDTEITQNITTAIYCIEETFGK